MKSYRDLDVYQRSYKLALSVHRLSFTLPASIQRDLGDQIRRASRSIPSNIVEGIGRGKSGKDTINHLRDSLGSNDEMLFNLEFMKDTQLIADDTYEELRAAYEVCGRQLHNLIKSFNTSN